MSRSFPASEQRAAPAAHPGAVLREIVLDGLGMASDALADALGVPAQRVADVLDESAPVDADLALRLGKLCGNGAPFWMRLQAAYDLDRVAPSIRPQLERIATAA